jgi:uncharacterized protein
VNGNGAGPWDERLVAALRPGYRLRWDGIHGWPHWVRVRENGARLAIVTGADLDVVHAFALLHDVARRNDAHDPKHGARAAALIDELPDGLLGLDRSQLEQLTFACAHHTEGLLEADVTIQTCWDADRLDLGRVGIEPEPGRLCTEAARRPEILAWAWRRSISDESPTAEQRNGASHA